MEKESSDMSWEEAVSHLHHIQQIFLDGRKASKELRERLLRILADLLRSGRIEVQKTCESVFHNLIQSLCVVALKPGHKRIDLPAEGAALLFGLAADMRKRKSAQSPATKEALDVAKELLTREEGTDKGFLAFILFAVIWVLVGNESSDVELLEVRRRRLLSADFTTMCISSARLFCRIMVQFLSHQFGSVLAQHRWRDSIMIFVILRIYSTDATESSGRYSLQPIAPSVWHL